MNSLTIIGNLTGDPMTHTTQSGVSFASFTVAVNRKGKSADAQETDFFRVTAWRDLGDVCAKFLQKGRKVCVQGAVSVSTFNAKDGTVKASMEVIARDVEFLSPKNDAESAYRREERAAIQNEPRQGSMLASGTGFVEVNEDLPF